MSNAMKATVSRNERKVRRGWTMDSGEPKNKGSTSQAYRASNRKYALLIRGYPLSYYFSRCYITSTIPFRKEIMDIPHHSGSTQSGHP
jgi:hypothetical protein